MKRILALGLMVVLSGCGASSAQVDALGEQVATLSPRLRTISTQQAELQQRLSALPEHIEALEAAAVEEAKYAEVHGKPYTLRCPDDMAVLGLQGRAGALVDSLALFCVRWRVTKRFSPNAETSVGGTGGQKFTLACPDETVLVGVTGRKGAVVDRIQGLCGKPGEDNTAAVATVRAAGGTGGEEFREVCPAGQVVVALTGRYGQLVNSVELECDTPTQSEEAPQ